MADEVDVGNDFAHASLEASRALATQNNLAGRCASYVPGQLTGPKLATEKILITLQDWGISIVPVKIVVRKFHWEEESIATDFVLTVRAS